MTQLQNSAFKVHSGSVPDVSKILPEPGAFIISEHDGNLYYADDFGWHQAEQPYSPVTLFVDFDGVTQFDFIFKAPATSTLEIHDGDGTVTEVAGQDDTAVTHTTNYSEAGRYCFLVRGDYVSMTLISLFGMGMATGSVNGWFMMPLLDNIQCQDATGLYGDLSRSLSLDTLVFLSMVNNRVEGDISLLENSAVRVLGINNGFTGDLSSLHSALAATSNLFTGLKITFDNIVSFALPGNLSVNDNNWTSKMVDNCLISLASGGATGRNINLGGNNAPRTSASDAAFAIVDAANTLTVNS